MSSLKNNNINSKLLKSGGNTSKKSKSVKQCTDFNLNKAVGVLGLHSSSSKSKELAEESIKKVGGFDELSNPNQEAAKPKERISHEIQELDFIPISPTPSSVEEDLCQIYRDNRKRNIRKTPLRQNASNFGKKQLKREKYERQNLKKKLRRYTKNQQARLKNCQKLKCSKRKIETINTNPPDYALIPELEKKNSQMQKMKRIIRDYLKLVKEGKRQFSKNPSKSELKELNKLTSLRKDDCELLLRGIKRFKSFFDDPAMKSLSYQWFILKKLLNKVELKRKYLSEQNKKALRSKSSMKPIEGTARDLEGNAYQIKDKQVSKRSSRINLKTTASEEVSHRLSSTKNQSDLYEESSEILSQSLNAFNWITLDACSTFYEDSSSHENEMCHSPIPSTPPEFIPWISENVPVEGNKKCKIGDQRGSPRSDTESSCEEIPLELDSKVSEVILLDENEEVEANKQIASDNAMSSKVISVKEASISHTSVDDDQISLSSEESFSVDIGSNIYVPGGVSFKGRRPIIIDGSNVAFAHGLSKRGIRLFSTRGLEICAKFFTKRGHKVIVFVPLFRRSDSRTLNPEILDKMADRGLITYTPSRKVNEKLSVPYDDRYIVQCAVALGGVIVSTDNFRDLLKENPTWRSTIEKRLLMFTFVGDMLIFPQDPLGRRGPKLDEFLMFPK